MTSSNIICNASKFASKVARVFLAGALAFGLAFAAGTLAPQDAQAAPRDPYPYQVRVFSGNQGTFKAGGDCYEFTKLKGAQVSLNQGEVELRNPDKYYVKGWQLAGKDDVTKTNQNNDSNLISSLVVNKDMDLVICYGVLVDAVNYTVRYVDQAGNDLYPPETFKGNVGDRPVIAFRYFEGYLPQAYNLTGELLSNDAENVFTFHYTALANPEEVTVTLPTEVPDAAATPGGTASAEGTPEAAQSENAETAPAVATEAPQDEEYIAEDGSPLAAPAEIEDIRDEETPMASMNTLARGDSIAEADIPLSEIPFVIGLALGAFIVAAVVIAYLLLQKRKQNMALLSATRASIAAGNTVDPVTLQSDYDANFAPLNSNQMDYADPVQTQYAPQPATTQQYVVPDIAQQYPAQYDAQQYGNMQFGGQIDGQYGQYGQYDQQFGTSDDQ